MDRVVEKLDQSLLGRTILDGLIREVVQARREQFAELEAKETQTNEVPQSQTPVVEVTTEQTTEDTAPNIVVEVSEKGPA